MPGSSEPGAPPYRLLFVIGAPRSGTTLLERMLSAHSQVAGGPEPHLLTPLAHLGVWAKVDKAPYDHVLAAEAQKAFVARLPGKEADYWRACRAYCDVLYGQFMAGRSESVCLDKTPAYALVLPFLARVFPDARYVVLTRHPCAIFSSYANSFFDGDYAAAETYNPILDRYVPALASFLRQQEVPGHHVRYEDLVAAPEPSFEAICDYAGIPFEPAAIAYGESAPDKERPKGLGDPIGVDRNTRPTSASADKWAGEVAHDPEKRARLEAMIARLDPADLETLGYPPGALWRPVEEAGGTPPRKPRLTRYRLQRKLIVRGRALVQRTPPLRRLLERIRLAADILLRE